MNNNSRMRGAGDGIARAPAFFRAPARAPSSHGGPGPWLMGVRTLTGDKVLDGHGDTLGSIEEIMLEPDSGTVAYAVLSFGGFLGLGNKLFAIPWRALELDTERKCFVLDVDRERLKLAPGFDKNHWPSMSDRTWAYAIHEFYETKPYWAR